MLPNGQRGVEWVSGSLILDYLVFPERWVLKISFRLLVFLNIREL